MADRSNKHLVLGVAIAGILGAGGVYVLVTRNSGSSQAHGVSVTDDKGPLVPEFQFTNFDGKEVGSTELAGKIWVADFVFTSCSGTCPRMSNNMSALQEALAGIDFQLVTVTCDPANDTPERLAASAANYGAIPHIWYWVRGDKRKTQEFAEKVMKLGLRETTPAEQQQGMERIVHSSRFVLVDPAGRIRGWYDGLDQKAFEKLVTDARKIAEETPGK